MRTALAVALLVGGCDVVFSLDRPDGWEEVTVGNTHACARTHNRELYCWGENSFGQVGVGDELSTIDRPTRVEGEWTSVSATFLHTCAVRDDATAWCWGINGNGMLGNGSTTPTRIPKQVDGTWSTVVAGYFNSCGLDDDKHLWCWGANHTGQLGDGTLTQRLSPVQIGDARWSAVAMGTLHTCGIRDNGTLWCWGDYAMTPTMPVPDPALAMGSLEPVQIGDETWRDIASVIDGTCGITTAGRLRCWGMNKNHQIGLGDVVRADEPTAVLVDGTDADDWTQVEGGVFTACAVRANGEAWCWGDNQRGELASEETSFVLPLQVPHPSRGRWARASVGTANACLIDEQARAWCAGGDSFSQLGDGGTSPRTPTPPAPDAPADVIVAGDHVTCAINAGQISCGGKGAFGQLGNGDGLSQRALVPISGTQWRSVTTSLEHTCALDTAGTASCWGSDESENLGNGPGTVTVAVPSPVMTTRVFAAIDAGVNFTCGVDSARAIACWGENGVGQLGTNNTVTAPMPVSVVPAMTWNAVSAGDAHACGIDATGVVRCWGDNHSGQLGDNTTEERHAPVILTAGFSVVPAFSSISAGGDHACAIGANDSLWCWGGNARGQLGIDTGFLVAIPSAKELPGKWSSVSAGTLYTCAIRTDQTLWCWGANHRGQLGDGSLIDRRAPVQIEGIGWTAVSAGTDHTCGRRGSSVSCWGNNDDGATVTGDSWLTELQEIVEPPR